MALEKVRLAVVGAGFMGEAHIQAIIACSDAALVAVCDSSPERLADLCQRYQVARGYRDYLELFRQEELDGVVIATPDHLHLAPVEAAAASRVHVLLEKPIATTLKDADRILQVVKETGITLQLGFTLRHDPSMLALHAQIQEGVIGQPTQLYAKRQCRVSEGRRLGHRVNALEYLGIHDIDLALWYLGTDLAQVYATSGTFVLADLNTPDYYWTVLKWHSGATAVIHSSWAMSNSYPKYVEASLELFGTEGAVFVQSPGDLFLTCNDQGCDYSAPGRAVKLRDQISRFVDAICHGTEPVVRGADGWNALRVVKAAEESILVGRPVPVDLISDKRGLGPA